MPLGTKDGAAGSASPELELATGATLFQSCQQLVQAEYATEAEYATPAVCATICHTTFLCNHPFTQAP